MAAASTREEDVFLNLRMKQADHARLKKLAVKNERTVSAEIRLAVRERLDEFETDLSEAAA